jgi:hypothetical protein
LKPQNTKSKKNGTRWPCIFFFWFLGLVEVYTSTPSKKKRTVFEIENEPKKKRFPFLNLYLNLYG